MHVCVYLLFRNISFQDRIEKDLCVLQFQVFLFFVFFNLCTRVVVTIIVFWCDNGGGVGGGFFHFVSRCSQCSFVCPSIKKKSFISFFSFLVKIVHTAQHQQQQKQFHFNKNKTFSHMHICMYACIYYVCVCVMYVFYYYEYYCVIISS